MRRDGLRAPRRWVVTGGAAALVLTLSGCGGSDPVAQPVSSPSSATPSATPTDSPSPTSTLSASKQQTVDEAIAAVLNYEQAYLDIFSAPSPDLTYLNSVAAQPQLDEDRRAFQKAIVAGDRVQSVGPVVIRDVKALNIRLGQKTPTVTLVVCVDGTTTAGTHAGAAWTGGRQAMQYRVVQTAYLPRPGWAVAEVLPPPNADGPVQC